jgi:hypothetical protein
VYDQVREKELQKQKLEDLIVGGPGAFPSSEAGLITAEVRKKEYLRDALDMQVPPPPRPPSRLAGPPCSQPPPCRGA